MIMLAAFAFALTCTPHVAQASYLEKFIGVISQGTAAEKICRKASFFGGVFSIRSFEGRACSIKLIGAFAETVCPEKAGDYMSSQCHGIAVKALGGQDARIVLAQEISKISNSARNSFCAKAGNVNPALSVACAKASTMKPETDGTTGDSASQTNVVKIERTPAPLTRNVGKIESAPLTKIEKQMAITEITQEKQKIETLQQKVQKAPQIVMTKRGESLSSAKEKETKARLLEAAQKLSEAMKGLSESAKSVETGDITQEEVQKELEKAKTVENEVAQDLE